MNLILAIIVVIVLVATGWAIKYILGRETEKTGLCVPVVSNVLIPAGTSPASVACCLDQSGACLSGYTSAWGTVALIPTTLTPSCPVQILTPDQYGSILPSASGNQPVSLRMDQLGKLYTAGSDCGDIQAAITRLCYPTTGGYDPSSCVGGIAAVQDDATQTITCSANQPLQPTRRMLVPGNFSKATCKSTCCYADLDTGGPVPSVSIDAKKDAGSSSPCAGQPIDEVLFYQCMGS